MGDTGPTQAAYGQDAPGVMMGFLAGGALAILIALAVGWALPPGAIRTVIVCMVALVGAVPFGLGMLMLIYGRIGKFRVRDAMLDAVPWSGNERVLDIGTGAGLLLVGAAKRLSTGKAIGIDIWSAKDLSHNGQATTLRNLAVEGVSDRAEIQTADARHLPLSDASIDRVFSLLCLHNIESKADQAAACREIARVLAPGGFAVIGDYMNTARYAESLQQAGLRLISSRPYFATALSLMWIAIAARPES